MAATNQLTNNTPAQREQLFIGLYKKSFPSVAKYVSKMGGSFDEAKDVFQDALVIYYEKLTAASLPATVSDQAYLVGIAKHIWLKKFRHGLQTTPIENCLLADRSEEETGEPSEQKLMHYLETAGQRCMDMLRAFYYDKIQADKIAELFGFNGARSATVQKYKCLEKVRETIKERSLVYEDFVE